jgi:uncharacterized membrane protein YfcA
MAGQLLLPLQVSVLGTPSPAVTPTNLLYNVVATPGALYRYWRQGQTGGRLALVLIAGAVLLPLRAWLAMTRAAWPGGDGGPGSRGGSRMS